MTGTAQIHRTSVAIIGGGQAGLSASWFLTRDGVDHVVFEARTAAHEWDTSRWDTFTLVTPNWQCRLPGYPYDGPDPDGFMTREQVTAWIGGYAATFGPPLREHTAVTALTRDVEGGHGAGFVLQVAGPDGAQTWYADQVVLATGGYHLPIVPAWASGLATEIEQLHSADYKNPDQLPAGAVLVVGTGQSGSQIAEDLHLAGRQVHLALGDAPRVARFYRGRDVMTWLSDMGLYDTPVAQYPGGATAREKTNHYVTGRDGGRDLDLRVFAAEGMQLHGLLETGQDHTLTFRPGVAEALEMADRVYNSICRDVDRWIEQQGIEAPAGGQYTPVWEPGPEQLELDLAAAGVRSIVWAIGYRPDYRWVDLGVFAGNGRPVHTRGVTSVPGLFFLGLPWLHTWGSGRFLGIAADAEHVTGEITSRASSAASPRGIRAAG